MPQPGLDDAHHTMISSRQNHDGRRRTAAGSKGVDLARQTLSP
jgi:hypothetical protein